MDFYYLFGLSKTILRELFRFRFPALIVGIIFSLVLLAVGVVYDEKYEVTTTLYADRQNIIQPLLEGKASVTDVEEQLQEVYDVMMSTKNLEAIINEEGLVANALSEVEVAEEVARLRKQILISMLGPNYISVKYNDVDPKKAYNIINKVVSFFIKESSENKRSESRQAFVFIDKQVGSYKDQLRAAETKLKDFKASNLDGSEGKVENKIEKLRTQIGDLTLDLEQATVRVDSLQKQIAQENEFLVQQASDDEFRERIRAAVERLDTLKLSLTDSHPDVISMQQHIASLESAAKKSTPSGSAVRSTENPVYDELRASLASAQVDKQTLEKKLNSLQSRLTEERARAKRIAVRNAELSELIRDYDVTKEIYEDLLERKEKARLSMTLDIEGQGVSYKVQEPAKFPLSPTGLKFIHFIAIGLVAAFLVPIGLVVMYVLIDPRVRFSETLDYELDVPILGVVPKLTNELMVKQYQSKLKGFLFLVVLYCVSYAALAVFYVSWSN